MCWNPIFELFAFFACSCCRTMSVSHRPSSSQALYFVANTVHSNRTATMCGPLLTMCADKNIAHACVLCLMGVCVGVCGSVDSFVSWHSKFQLSFFYLVCSVCLLLAAAAVSCRLYHTVPQALELSTLWHPRHDSSRTASLCGPLLWVCWHCICVCVMCVCYDT